MSTTTHASLTIALNKQGTTKKEYSVKTCFTSLFVRLQSLTGITMNKKFTSVFCIVLGFAIMSVSPANARILTTLSGTQVTVTKNSVFEPETIIVECGDGSTFEFNYYQRVIINGQTAMVAVEVVYPVGTHTLYLEGQCGGYNVYGVGSCSCKRTDFNIKTDFKNCLPTDFKNTVANLNIENTPKEIAEPVQMRLIIAPLAPKPVGFLCIRKNVIKKESTNIV